MSDSIHHPEAANAEQKPKKLLPATRDTFIHFLFGTPGNEWILLDFVNAMLENDGRPLARSVEMRNPFNPATFVTDKYTILDVKATGDRGDIFVIEFQTADRDVFAKRMVYYCGKAYCAQMGRGDTYDVLNPVIGMAIITYLLVKHIPSPHNSFYLRATADPECVLTDAIQMHVLEIVEEKADKFSVLKPRLECWSNFFLHAHTKSEAEMKVLTNGNSAVEAAYDAFKQFNADARMRALDDAHQRYLHDYNTDLEAAHQKGIEEEGLRARINAIEGILTKRFKNVPQEIIDTLNSRKDITALESLVIEAAICESLSSFSVSLG